jgi:hypothetical protein
MSKVEKLLVFIVFTGVTFKLLHLPGAYPLIILAFGGLSIYYFMASAAYRSGSAKFLKSWYNYDDVSKWIVPNFIFAYVYSIILVAILFRIMLYPNSAFMADIAGIGFLIAVGYTFFKERDKALNVLKQSKVRIMVFLGLLLFLFAVSESAIISLYYPNNPEYAKALNAWHQDSRNRELSDSLEVLRLEMEAKNLVE